MKKILLLVSIGFIFSISSCDIRKQDKKAPNQNQKININREEEELPPTTIQLIDTVHNFGTIKEGDIAEYNFRFKNTGKNPLRIKEALASCGCTVPEKPENDILPGEMGFIKVKFNSTRKPGEIEKTITITSNADPEFPQLMMKGTVIGKEE